MNINTLTKSEVKFLQTSCRVRSDGMIGPSSLRAMRAYTGFEGYEAHVVPVFIQTLINNTLGDDTIKVDGIFGPRTETWLGTLMDQPLPQFAARRPVVSARYVKVPKEFDVIGSNPPKAGTPNLTKHFGRAGNEGALVKCLFPNRMYYGGSIVRSTRVHRKTKESFEYLFEGLLAHFGQTEMDRMALTDFSGCYNFRAMRGGKSYSTHSWGIALDLNAASNRLRYKRSRAKFGKAKYQEFFNIAYRAGFKSLGVERDRDWMHLQHTSTV